MKNLKILLFSTAFIFYCISLGFASGIKIQSYEYELRASEELNSNFKNVEKKFEQLKQENEPLAKKIEILEHDLKASSSKNDEELIRARLKALRKELLEKTMPQLKNLEYEAGISAEKSRRVIKDIFVDKKRSQSLLNGIVASEKSPIITNIALATSILKFKNEVSKKYLAALQIKNDIILQDISKSLKIFDEILSPLDASDYDSNNPMAIIEESLSGGVVDVQGKEIYQDDLTTLLNND